MKVMTTSSMTVQAGGAAGDWPAASVSLCLPHTVRMHTRKVRVATITSHGWVEQNSPWDLNTLRTVVVSITSPCVSVVIRGPTLKTDTI